MFERILVPVDLSERGREAVRVAALLAKPSSGRVYLIHVIETIPGLDFEEERKFYDRLEARALALVADLAKGLDEIGVAWEGNVVFGSRAQEILRRAEELTADLIVLSSHRVNHESPSEGWGTLSYQLAVLSRRKVLLLK